MNLTIGRVVHVSYKGLLMAGLTVGLSEHGTDRANVQVFPDTSTERGREAGREIAEAGNGMVLPGILVYPKPTEMPDGDYVVAWFPEVTRNLEYIKPVVDQG